MIVWRVCDRWDKGFACVSVKKRKKPHEAPPLLVQSGGGGGGDDLALLAPPEMCLSLSPRNAAAAASLVSWPACLPAANTAPAAALNTIAANHHFHPHSTPPTPQQPHPPPPRHPRNHPPRQQTTPRQVSVANGISCALTNNVLCRQSDAGPAR